ncbi:MAG: hypothetical protein H6Q64_522, partial [Firmicutes bacterium]|nr:hypothetical protein [Bacillota bacterium]
GLETALGNADTTVRTIDDALNKYKKTSSTTVTTPVNSGTNTSKTLSDMQTNLNKFFANAGDDYFDDDNIVFNINLSGNTVDLYYDITLDCEDADKYDRLTKISQSKIKSLLNIVKSQIASETYGTNYEKANVTGKLSDQDNSGYYVKYSGSTYSFSWNENNMLSDITEYLDDYFENGGDVYFGDSKIAFEFNISGDEDDLKYEIFIDFDDAYDYDDLSEVDKTYVRNFLNKVKTCITSKTDGTDFEDANITGFLYDDDDNDYYVKYTGSSYTFSY